jgi:hypothetical protein
MSQHTRVDEPEIEWIEGMLLLKRPGPPGPTGPTGPTGAGATGALGPTGPAGLPGVSAFSNFYADMPGDNAATIAVGAPLLFPNNGPTSATPAAVRTGAGTFNIPVAGTYQVTMQVSVTEAGQFQLAIGGVALPHTTSGRATGTTQIVINTIITTGAPNQVLSVINPVGNSTALTITPIAGGAATVSATLNILKLA